MTSLDPSGIITRVCSDLKSRFDSRYQATLRDGIDIKRIGSESLLGSGNLSISDIGAATEAHSHGSISKTGTITSDTTVASGDKLVITDSSANSRLARSGIAFGTSTTTFLANNGTWQTIGVGVYGSLTALTSNTTLTSSAAKLPLKTFSGVGCSASSNGIKVSEAGKYMVWGSAYAYGSFTANDIIHLRLYKNSTYLSLETIYRTPLATPYNMIYMGPFIVDLAANDVLYLYAYNQTAARGTIQSSESCGLVICKIA